MAEERRHGRRLPAHFTAIIKNCSTGKVQRWLTKDVSGSGLCLVTNESIECGTRLEVELKLPDFPNPLLLQAIVARVTVVEAPKHSYEEPKIEMGIKFVDLPQKTQALLNQYAVVNAPPPDFPST